MSNKSVMAQICNGRARNMSDHQPLDSNLIQGLKRKCIVVIYLSSYCKYLHFYYNFFCILVHSNKQNILGKVKNYPSVVFIPSKIILAANNLIISKSHNEKQIT